MKKYVFPLVIGSILIGAGIILSMFEFMQFKYTESYNMNFTENIEQTDFYNLDNKILKIIIDTDDYYVIKDENIKDQVSIKYTYYPDYVEIIKNEKAKGNHRELRINFDLKYRNSKAFKDFYNTVIDNLKNKQIYNYSLLFRPYIQITINPNDLNRIKLITN